MGMISLGLTVAQAQGHRQPHSPLTHLHFTIRLAEDFCYSNDVTVLSPLKVGCKGVAFPFPVDTLVLYEKIPSQNRDEALSTVQDLAFGFGAFALKD